MMASMSTDKISSDTRAEIVRLLGEGKGDDAIARKIGGGLTRHQVRVVRASDSSSEACDVVVSEKEEAVFHPLANLFPLIGGEGFDALVEDIKANGLMDKIVVYEGAILDGRNRYRALLKLNKFKPHANYAAPLIKEEPYKSFFIQLPLGKDPLDFVKSKNQNRRHLSINQRAMVAVDLANMKRRGCLSRSSRKWSRSCKRATTRVC
jgi:hypothetical protein